MLFLARHIVLAFDASGIFHDSKTLSSSASFYLNPLFQKRLDREHLSHFTDMRTEAPDGFSRLGRTQDLSFQQAFPLWNSRTAEEKENSVSFPDVK